MEPEENQPTDYNVLFLTLDGVRWQEFFLGSDPLLTDSPEALFPQFWKDIAPLGRVYGDPRAGSVMSVSTVASASLPGYMSIFAEEPQDCLTNFCNRIEVPTLLDRLKDELGYSGDDIAVIAAWSKMALAVTGRDDVGTVFASNSNDFIDEEAHSWSSLEFDRGPIAHGLRYLREKQPRFLYLALWDSDRFAHRYDYGRYLNALQVYDALIHTLVTELGAMGDYGRKTAVVISTDHGRGVRDQWSEHGPHIPASGRIWAYVMLPPDAEGFTHVDPNNGRFEHHDLRRTLHRILGLGSRGCCGKSLVVRSAP